MRRPVGGDGSSIRPALAGLVPYEPGKPVEEVQRELGLDRVVKLASNEGPYGPFLGIIACSVPFVLLLFWPFLDRTKERHPKKRPFAVGIGLVALLGAIFLGWLGHISETNQTFLGRRYHIDLKGWPHPITDDDKSEH